ncbi:WD40-repeat-containing domain protein [Fomes fomentarius]|nr:WD40-repeat-containing domain protein [Fomes fomentarius]
MDHANVRGGYELKQEDIIFVSGTTKTTRWANAAFHGSYRQKEGSISCGVNGVGKFSMKLSIANRNLPNPMYNYGPSSLDSDIATVASTAASDPGVEPPRLATTQCIFFHYYKMKKRILWRPRPIRAAAGPDELPPDDDNAGGNEQVLDLDFEEHPQSSPPYDPVEILLEWILEHSNAEIAVATDRDLIAMFPTTGIPLDVRAGLEEAPPSIDVDEEGVGTVVVDLHLIEGEHPSAQQVANPVAEEEAGSTNQLPDIGDSSTFHPMEALQVEQPSGGGDEGSTEGEAVKRTPGAGIAATNVHNGAVVSLAVSPDSKWVASGSEGGNIILWDAGSQSDVRNWESHADSIGDLAFSPDSRRLLSAGGDGQIMIWDVEQGGNLLVATLEGHSEAIHSAVWSPDGTKIASASEDMTVRVWDTETYEQIHLLEGHNAMVTFVRFSSDGTMLASGGADYNCRIWNVDAGTIRYELQGHKGMVWSAAFDPECRRIATASDDGSVRIWSTSTGDALVTLQEHHGPVWNVAFSGDGKEIMSASSDSTIKVCDSYSGERKLSLDGHDSMVNSACFSPDGKYIASASSDSTVRLWKTSNGTCVRTFNEHNDKVTHALFTPNGETLSSGADDGTVRIRVLSDWV